MGKIIDTIRMGLWMVSARGKHKKVEKLKVISGIGVRNYYRKLGYKLEKNYMVKKF